VCVILGCFVNFLDDPYYEPLPWFMMFVSKVYVPIMYITSPGYILFVSLFSGMHCRCIPVVSFDLPTQRNTLKYVNYMYMHLVILTMYVYTLSWTRICKN